MAVRRGFIPVTWTPLGHRGLAMARKVRAGDAKLMSRTARETLRPSRKPYYRPIERGIALGYRKPKKGPAHGSCVDMLAMIITPCAILSRRMVMQSLPTILRMQTAKRSSISDRRKTSIRAHKNELDRQYAPSTVADALDDYFRFLKSDGRSEHAIRDAYCRANALILPKLGTVKITALTSDRLRRWRDELVSTAPRLRTRQGDDQKYRRVNGEDAQRARRASANRTWTILRAALNHSFTEGKINSDSAWRKVRPFKGVECCAHSLPDRRGSTTAS